LKGKNPFIKELILKACGATFEVFLINIFVDESWTSK